MRVSDLIVESYLLDEMDGMKVTLDRRVQRDGSVMWRIGLGSTASFTKNGEFELEPRSSSKDHEFLDSARWDDPQEALDFWNNHKSYPFG